MWRRNAVRFGSNGQENQDSDQSISEEEEDLDNGRTGNTISLGRGENKKGTMQVLSQLEILRGSCELQLAEKESISSHGIKGGYHIEDEVEIPFFSDGDVPSHNHRIASDSLAHSKKGIICLPSSVASISYSDEEIISDDEKINPPALTSSRENLGGTCSEASRKVEALVWSNETRWCSAHDAIVKEKKSSRGAGGREKAKPKFLFPFHSHKKNLSLGVSDNSERTSSENIPVADEIADAADDDIDNYTVESQLNFHDKESKQRENHIDPFEMAHKHDSKGHSMAEFLNCFIERSDLQQGSSKLELQKKRRRVRTDLKGNTSPLGDSILAEDDLPEDLDYGAPFSEDEENARSVKSIIPRSMADQFHEAFGTVSVIDDRLHVAFPGTLCSGLSRKLQQVIQSEKERDMDSLKNASAETGFKDEGMSVMVRILSRSLEAKLIVCSCISVGDGKTSYWESNMGMKMKGIERTLTIIFSQRICSTVDLEVGNLILIHPPWKEVQVKDKAIFLCSYFAQVQS